MPDQPAPYIPVGQSVRLIAVEYLAAEMCLPLQLMRDALARLKIPLVLTDGTEYFALHGLESVLYAALDAGGWSLQLGINHPHAPIQRHVTELPDSFWDMYRESKAQIQTSMALYGLSYGLNDQAACLANVRRLARVLLNIDGELENLTKRPATKRTGTKWNTNNLVRARAAKAAKARKKASR